jgi:DNA-directed RNA polymerase specialized sigma24 family protein
VVATIPEGDEAAEGPLWSFDVFVARVEPRLRRALMAAYGPERGREATAEALAWAWEHQERMAGLSEPVGYLYRVGQSRSRRRRFGIPFVRDDWSDPVVEPELIGALGRLSERQRVAVVLVHGYGWTLVEVAALLGIGATTVQNHVERGLDRLRGLLEVSDE